MIKNKYEDIFKFAQEVLDNNIKLLNGQNANSLPKSVVLYHYRRAFSLLYAIKILCEQGFATEGMVLLRSLLNLYINVKWLTTGNIDSRMKRFVDFEIIIRYRGIKTLRELGEVSKEEGDKELEKMRERYEKIKKKYNLKGNPRYWCWSEKSIRQMAKEVSLIKEYEIIYPYLSEREHTSPVAARDYLDNSRRGYTMVRAEPSNSKIDMVIFPALGYFLNVKEIALDTFDMDLTSLKIERQELSKLENKYWGQKG